MSNPLSDPEIEVGVDEVEAALADRGVVVVDVRETYERQAGRIPGTVHIAMDRLAFEAETLDRDTPIIFQCRMGVRSLMAAHAFRAAGFQATSMAGGILAWVAAGRPLSPPDGIVADH